MRRLFETPRLPLWRMVTFGILPSRVKNLLLRLQGHQVHPTVRWGVGSVVEGQSITIGEHVEIGHATIVRGREVAIGSRTSIGSMTFIDCPQIRVGEDAKINEYVFVGGFQTPESAFDLGSRTTLMQYSFVNTTKPVRIGDDSGVGGHCLLFTHASWLSVFDGYPVTFAPIDIGESVWLPWRVFVLPGSTLGDGCVIGANSVVRGEIPPRSLALGSPAKVVRQAPDFPKQLDHDVRVKLLREILDGLVEYLQFNGAQAQMTSSGHEITVLFRGTAYSLRAIVSDRMSTESVATDDPLSANHVVIYLLDAPVSLEQMSPGFPASITGMDLLGKTRWGTESPFAEEVALFFERYGIRLRRIRIQ